MKAQAVDISFDGLFSCNGKIFSGNLRLTSADAGKVFSPDSPACCFWIDDVTIGIGFHWERKQRLAFTGRLEVASDPDGCIRIINEIPVEDYLASVISSEMNSHAHPELLRAHAVISRTWLWRMLNPNPTSASQQINSPTEVCRWYDREDHIGFDVCADDHCQRYQGVTRIVGHQARRAVNDTRGLVLFGPDNKVVDARFSKCCGGAFERFDSCWDSKSSHPCLQPALDVACADAALPDLSDESTARGWILSKPQAFCNTSDPEVLNQVLNDFDSQTTPDFFRWEVEYSPLQLSRLIQQRSGRHLGTIHSLTPLSRGSSGRIFRLRIQGSEGEVTVGKELEIRRWLSDSHLKSSAFVIDRTPEGNFLLRGAGWGHGVGMCQIGAAMMALKGFSFNRIISHYYRQSRLVKLW